EWIPVATSDAPFGPATDPTPGEEVATFPHHHRAARSGVASDPPEKDEPRGLRGQRAEEVRTRFGAGEGEVVGQRQRTCRAERRSGGASYPGVKFGDPLRRIAWGERSFSPQTPLDLFSVPAGKDGEMSGAMGIS